MASPSVWGLWLVRINYYTRVVSNYFRSLREPNHHLLFFLASLLHSFQHLHSCFHQYNHDRCGLSVARRSVVCGSWISRVYSLPKTKTQGPLIVDQELLTKILTLATSPSEPRSLSPRKWPIRAPTPPVVMVKAIECTIFLHWAAWVPLSNSFPCHFGFPWFHPLRLTLPYLCFPAL